MKSQDDRYAAGAVSSSAIVRFASAALCRVASAWTESRPASLWVTFRAGQSHNSAADRVRFWGTTLCIAALVSWLLRSLTPAYAAPALPWWWYASASAIAALVAARATAIAAAWPHSVGRRLLD